MSEVLALALVPLRLKAVNGCLTKFLGQCCEPVPHVLLDIIIRAFLGDQKWHNCRERGLDCMEGDQELPTVHIDHLQHYAREGNEFLARVVAGDESWCHHFKPESKRQSLQWKHPGSPPPKKSKAIHTSAGKVILMFFFDQDVPLLIDFLQCRTTVNAQRYSQTLTTLRQVIKSKQPGKLTHGVILLRQCKASYSQHNHGTLAEIQVGDSRSPSIQSRPLSLPLYHLWYPKKGSKGQTIHLR